MDVVLTAGERQELVTVLRELDPTAPKERRGSVRRKTLLNLWMQRIGENEGGTISKVVLVNVSVSGVGILTKMPFLRGEKFAIPLPFAEGGGWLVLCEVRNCQRLMSGHYKVGGRFIDRIEDDNGDAKIPGNWLKK